jgi:hypothetical protein
MAVHAPTAGTTAPPTPADSEPVPDFWNLIARMVRLERMAISTWWIVAIESRDNETPLGVAHLDDQRELICRLSKDGKRIIGSSEGKFRSILSGILVDRLDKEKR